MHTSRYAATYVLYQGHTYVAYIDHVTNQNDPLYSGTSLSRIPLGNLFLSFTKRCPLFRGLRSTSITDLGPRRRCPLRGVSLIQGYRSTVLTQNLKIELTQ